MIFIKNHKVLIWRTKGTFRKIAKRDAKNYRKGKRSLTETINSILKRVYGKSIAARTLKTQKVEIMYKILALNLERLIYLRKKSSQAHINFPSKNEFRSKNAPTNSVFLPSELQKLKSALQSRFFENYLKKYRLLWI